MEYRMLKNIGKTMAITAVAALPYVYESCGYSSNSADAAGVKIERCHPTPAPEPAPKPEPKMNLEFVVNK